MRQDVQVRIAHRVNDILSRAKEHLKSSGETTITRNFIEPNGDEDYEITITIKATRT